MFVYDRELQQVMRHARWYRFWRGFWQGLFWSLIVAGVLAVVAIPAYTLANYTCDGQWGQSSLPAKFDWLGGCLLQMPDGTWVPASGVRIEVRP